MRLGRLLKRRARPFDPIQHLMRRLLGRPRRLGLRLHTVIEERACFCHADATPVLFLLLLRVRRARGHQRGRGGVRVVMAGEHVRRHRQQPAGRLLLLGEGSGCYLGRVRRGRGRVAALLELVDVHHGPPFVWELLRPRVRVRSFEETTLVAELYRERGVSDRPWRTEDWIQKEAHTTLPGVRLDRRQVEVSVVWQL